MIADPIKRRALVRALARKLRQDQQIEKARLEAEKEKLKSEKKLQTKRESLDRGRDFTHRMGREYAIKVGAHPNSDHWKNRKDSLARMKDYHAANREKIRVRKRNYYLANRQKCLDYARAYKAKKAGDNA